MVENTNTASPNSFLAPDVKGPQFGTLVEGKLHARRHRTMGVYDRQGLPLPYCDIKANYLKTEPDGPILPVRDAKTIEGPVLFAGLTREQFGHVILNSLGRLWALEHLPPETTLLFYARNKVLPRYFKHLRPMLDWLGIKNDFVISRGPRQTDQMFTASDLFGERYDGFGAPEFFEWLDRRQATPGPVDPNMRLYITRSRLGPEAGRFACEDHLEDLLREQGYTVFAPEAHDLPTQADMLSRAGRLIFAEGSALHFFGLIKRPEQIACMIQRRKTLPYLIGNQANARPGHEVRSINVIRRTFWPPRRSDHYSVSLLDFKKLKLALVEAGLINSDAAWAHPSFEAEKISLHAGLSDGEHMLASKGRKKFLADFRRKQREKEKRQYKASN